MRANISKRAAQNCFDFVRRIELRNPRHASRRKNLASIAGRISERNDWPARAKILIDLGRYLKITTSGLEQQQAIGIEHLDQCVSIADGPFEFDQAFEPGRRNGRLVQMFVA